ncbi:MAG: MerR family transcriptional regulator [Deltaproteobacteria bacterium]|nr:MerR family transcriptional regulator [Deltaproteobacteria bacterium]
MGYRIKTVSELTGIPKNTLIAWERRYGLVEPDRHGNRYRSYSDSDVALLKRIKRLLEEGYKISEAVDLVRDPSRQPEAARVANANSAAQDSIERARGELFPALLEFDAQRADHVLQRYGTLPYARLIEELYYPMLRDVGEGWTRGTVSIAQEHFVTAFCRERFLAMLMQVGGARGTGPHAVCTTFPGDLHELGVLGVSVLLALSGWRITYLGPNLPASELQKTGRTLKPDWVCTSLVIPTPPREIEAYLEMVREALPKRTWLVLGGAGARGYDCPVPQRVLVTESWRELLQDPT